MQIIFWQNIVSPHQAGFMRELAERGHDVTVVAQETMSKGRRRLGWEPPALGRANLVVGLAHADVRQIVERSPANAIHCIAGARVNRLGPLVTRECRAARRHMGIISETPDPRGLGGWLRWGKYAAERASIGAGYDFVLAMGETGVRWFRRCGYPSARVFPFCYVTEKTDIPPNEQAAGPPRFLFVGQLIDRKGVDLLLRAIAGMPGVELEVIGDGPQRDVLQARARDLAIGPRVRWCGKLDQTAIPARLSSGWAVVLPSRHDGWGAVVNEALMVGTPVICSAACGASDLLAHRWLGSVVPAGDVPALRSALVEWAGHGRPTAADRSRVRSWAACISGERVAAYMEAVFRHVYEGAERPVAPWRMQDDA